MIGIRGLGAALLLLLLLVGQPAETFALNDAQQLVVDAWRLVSMSYVDPVHLEEIHWRSLRQKALEKPIQSSAAAYGAIEAMLAPIGDSYTRLLRPADFAALRSNTQGTVSGVGLQLGMRPGDQKIVVIAPLLDSPAAEAGIPGGTEVLKVNGRQTSDLGLEATAAQLRGESGSEVLLLLRSGKGVEREVVLRRRQVDLRPVQTLRLQEGEHLLGYLRITQFADQVPEQVRRALIAFNGQSKEPAVEGLILDLRNNSGGLVNAGVAVANLLLDGVPIVDTKDRGGLQTRQQATPGSLYTGPMITLVNGGTASASEILAGALQDNGRSPLLGARTFGKGLIQTLISLGDGSGLAVTVARYLTPCGHDIQGQGILPDRLLSGPEPPNPGASDDAWVQEAARLLTNQASVGKTREKVLASR